MVTSLGAKQRTTASDVRANQSFYDRLWQVVSPSAAAEVQHLA